MTALYPSTSAAQVFVQTPFLLSTTGASAPINPDYADPTANYADFGLQLHDPNGDRIFVTTMDALPVGITAIGTELAIGGFFITVDPSFFTVAGQYSCLISYFPVANYSFQTASFQWGGWVDTLLGTVDSIDGLLTTTAATVDQTIAVLSASYDVDDPAAPTVQTLSVGGSPIATRTIANADGSAVNPAQVLILGELTAVP
tara:strand:- start:1847 stop:2449 length:603 start_codon:yes stop_codon:yes gene_type:complete